MYFHWSFAFLFVHYMLCLCIKLCSHYKRRCNHKHIWEGQSFLLCFYLKSVIQYTSFVFKPIFRFLFYCILLYKETLWHKKTFKLCMGWTMYMYSPYVLAQKDDFFRQKIQKLAFVLFSYIAFIVHFNMLSFSHIYGTHRFYLLQTYVFLVNHQTYRQSGN